MLDIEVAEGLNVHSEATKEQLNQMMIDYGQLIQQLVFTYVKDYAVAEDLTQEIFLKSYKKLHTFKQQSSLKTWIYRIAMNQCKDYLRSWQFRKDLLNTELIDSAVANEKDICQLVIEKTEEEKLVTALLELPIKYREAVYLFYYEDLTTKEISQLANENENTIKTRLNRARRMLKSLLGEEA